MSVSWMHRSHCCFNSPPGSSAEIYDRRSGAVLRIRGGRGALYRLVKGLKLVYRAREREI